jgi:hypothetical protein
VVFRDDRQVLLERLASLEREVEASRALRARIDELEAENQRLHAALFELRGRLAPPIPPAPAPSPSGRKVLALRIHGPDGARVETHDRDVTKIGRQTAAHVRLDGEGVSRMHAVIERNEEGIFFLVDLGSDVGVQLNGKRISKGALTTGDKVTIGPFVLSVAISGD